ncbi:MAG: type II toxin-antitoxin system RelE/ParE family toxin [Phycisphaeraceae bacterium]
MGQVIWSAGALDDVDAIAAFIARDSAERAALFAQRIILAADRLAVFPNAGRIIPEISQPTAREILLGDYRIMYRLRDNGDIWITAVIHGARDWPAD